MNIIFNNDMERIYLSSEYLFLKEHEANEIEFKNFEDFWKAFNANTLTVNMDDKFKEMLKKKAQDTYNIYINGKKKAN